MRQKVIIASKQSDEITYAPNLLQQFFFRTVERGIASPYILSAIKPYLKVEKSDKALVNAMTRAVQQRETEKNILPSEVGKTKGVFLLSPLLSVKVIMTHLRRIIIV